MRKRFLNTDPDKPNVPLNIACFFLPLAGALLVSPEGTAVVPCVMFIAALAMMEFGMSTARRDKAAALSALLGVVFLFAVAVGWAFVTPLED